MPPTAFARQPVADAAVWFASRAGRVVLQSENEAVRMAACERPGQAGLWLRASACAAGADGPALRLHPTERGMEGNLCSSWPLPLATESCGVVVLQHLGDLGLDPAMLLRECARVLLPGGRLWLLALNPLSPYRLRWRGQGPRASEPVTWRRRLRAAGLVPDPVSLGLGPAWTLRADPQGQDGAGLRAAFLVRAEKRRIPLTPQRVRAHLRWQAEPAA